MTDLFIPQSGLVVEVAEAEAVVGDLRHDHDQSAALGAPCHITILFPFVPPGEISGEIEARLTGLMAAEAGFGFSVADVRCFPEFVYLAPDPAQPFIALTELVKQAFPAYLPYEGAFPVIVPHLTIGHAPDDIALAVLAEKTRARLSQHGPIQSYARGLVWLENVSGRWERRASIPFGRL